MLMCISCRSLKTVAEALQASAAALRLRLQPPCDAGPCPMVIFVFHKLHPHLAAVSFAFLKPEPVFIVRSDVGIAEKHRGTYPVLYKILYNRAGARCAAAVEQDAGLSARDLYLESVLHDIFI